MGKDVRSVPAQRSGLLSPVQTAKSSGLDEFCRGCPVYIKALGLLCSFSLGIGAGLVGAGWAHQYLTKSVGLIQEDFFQKATESSAPAITAAPEATVAVSTTAAVVAPAVAVNVAPAVAVNVFPAVAVDVAPAVAVDVAPAVAVLGYEVFYEHAGLYLDKSFAPEFKNILLMTSANFGYLDMLQNWECYAKKLGLDYFVLAMDSKIYQFLGPDRSVLTDGVQVDSDSRFGSKNFTVVACNKLRTVMNLLEKTGLDLVFTDCDNVFRSDPFLPSLSFGSMMRSQSYEYIYGRKSRPPGPKEEDYHKEPDKANTGFYYVSGGRKRPGVHHIFGTAVEWCNKRPGIDDQENFWDSLVQVRKGKIKSSTSFKCFRHCGEKADSVCTGYDEADVFSYCDFSPWEYVEGSFGHAEKEKRLVAYHANWVQDRQASRCGLVGCLLHTAAAEVTRA
eukprot:TRINITY_DN5974_c0_g1_i1.p1 TRINITY_DN5974_c0_g1~~TRINITY_DN5974_c0_g1_i1.p1  ORF type:complete len:447 (+),score=79.31 TRINITY_DN5974_c0_g1_i1:25-1365(+)